MVAAGTGWAGPWIDRPADASTPAPTAGVAWLDVGAGHGAFLVVENINAVGNELASQLFDPATRAVSSAG